MSETKIALPVLDKNGQEAAKVELEPAVFAVTVNEAVIHDAVLTYLSNRRQDTAKTKKRHEVSGGGRKPYRQKGTGRARAGSSRSPLWVGGGTVFGPTGEQDHTIRQNKKQHRLALRSAWSMLVKNGRLVVIDDYLIADGKTKTVVSLLKTLKIAEGKILAVLKEKSEHESFVRGAKNLPNVYLAGPANVSVYDLLNFDHVLIDQEALSIISEALK